MHQNIHNIQIRNQIHDITTPKYLKKEIEKNIKFSQE